MNMLKVQRMAALTFAGVLLGSVIVAAQAQDATAASASAAGASTGAVTVSYVNPQSFSENKQFRNEDKYNDVKYLEPLKAYLVKGATRMLVAGDRLQVKITDIKLAGAYEPWRGPQARYIRYMKDIYPPRIDLDFTLIGPNGNVLREGSRKLRNVGYLTSQLTVPGQNDPLRYDKALLESWLRKGPQGL